MREDALPTSCDARPVSGPAKYGQFGVLAAEEVLSKSLKGVSFDNVAAVFIIDLAPKVGDFCQAFLQARPKLSHTCPLVYVAISDKQSESDWLQAALLEDLVVRVKAGTFSVPGAKANAEIPADLLQPFPSLPSMNLLVTKGDDDKKALQIPARLVKQWAGDAEFGSRFQTWLDEFLNTYEIAEEAAPGEQGTPEPALKRQKTTPAVEDKVLDASFLVDNDKVEGALLFDVKLAPKDALNFQLRAAHRAFLVNQLNYEFTLKAGAPVVGFGRGSFKLVKANETMDEKAVPFVIKNADALVCVSGAVMTIRDALQQQRKTKPDANVCYHSVKVPEDNPNSFVFSATHCVAYIPSGGTSKQKKENANPGDEDNGSEGGAVTANNVAAREALKIWEASPALKLVWWARWTVKGLTPVKPMLHIGLGEKLVLPVGKSYKVTAE